MGWALWAAAMQASDASAWQTLWADPQTLRAWGMTLWTGLASTALVWWTVARVLASGFIRQRLARWLAQLPALLATPHAAMAIGLVLWLAPSGWALRLVSPGFSGWQVPPPWATTQDPWGLGLVVALWFKEVPFLLWVAATHMQREDVRRRWQGEYAVAQTLGYTPAQAFSRVLWPQLARRLRWPALAVLAYGLTVVDMAVIIGPAAPPTLAVLAWQWLANADLATQAQGAAAAVWLTGSVPVLALLQVLTGSLWRGVGGVVMPWFAGRGDALPVLKKGTILSVACAVWGAVKNRIGVGVGTGVGGPGVWGVVVTGYIAVWWALAVGSVSGAWPFPSVWPTFWTGDTWAQVMASAPTVWTTLGLAVASASVCLVWSVAWLEVAPRRWQLVLRPVWWLPLVLPAVLWAVGLYSVVLPWRLEGQWLGLWLAHALMALPYVLLALEPVYQAVDPRQRAVVASLGHGRWAYLLRIQWPLLRRALASAWAVGFAVSVAQYLPTLYVGAGRWATVTTEAVSLAAGGQRALMSAYAALQMLLPVLAFALAAWLGRPRQFEKIAPMKGTP